MQQKLITYFSEIMPLTADEIEAIVESMTIRSYQKGDILLAEGQVSMECYFILEGCVRQYYLIDGEEKTTQFFTENDWVVSFNSFTQKIPSNHYLVCNEDTTLVVGNEDKENALYQRFPKFESISRNIMGNVYGQQQELTASYVTDTPEQRYLKLLELRPNLLQRIPQYQLASYIGVKPESLSRIRRRIMQRH
ncbi:Crp/Fnr family transcriptional regulator [Runella sp. MFBS21]|uniref:Crp/Fnr family transcriptional regulator n=1 Tax=Runella sp. MFBS21 TaxID=3034018 RepID=UPI0023F6EEB9|nr:Crp/Fnr family transcriptional regulator [Runella sp. MFBS21]MDF7817541.1 Crp/Fnr family transcriptional regulator [Runella sp. MFBS21]